MYKAKTIFLQLLSHATYLHLALEKLEEKIWVLNDFYGTSLF